MHIKILSEVPFLHKTGIKEGDIIEKGGGTFEFYTSEGYRQVLKKSEYDRLIAASDKAGKTKKVVEEVEEEETTEEVEESAKDKRKAELEKKSRKQLLTLANEAYDGIDKKTPEPELIELILKAEFGE